MDGLDRLLDLGTELHPDEWDEILRYLDGIADELDRMVGLPGKFSFGWNDWGDFCLTYIEWED